MQSQKDARARLLGGVGYPFSSLSPPDLNPCSHYRFRYRKFCPNPFPFPKLCASDAHHGVHSSPLFHSDKHSLGLLYLHDHPPAPSLVPCLPLITPLLSPTDLDLSMAFPPLIAHAPVLYIVDPFFCRGGQRERVRLRRASLVSAFGARVVLRQSMLIIYRRPSRGVLLCLGHSLR